MKFRELFPFKVIKPESEVRGGERKRCPLRREEPNELGQCRPRRMCRLYARHPPGRRTTFRDSCCNGRGEGGGGEG